MKTKNIGSLWALARKQLEFECDINVRLKYNTLDIIDYMVVIRKQLDHHSRKGEINSVTNIKTGKIALLENKQLTRHKRYLRTGK